MPPKKRRAPRRVAGVPLVEAIERLAHAMGHLRERIEATGQNPLVRQTVTLMSAAADGAPVDVQYEAVLHLATHVVDNLIACPCPARALPHDH